MYHCEECGKELGPKAKMYPMFLDDGNCSSEEPWIFAICTRCIRNLEYVRETE